MFGQFASNLTNQKLAAQQREIQARIHANQIIDNERRYAFVEKYPTLKVGPWTIPTTPILPKIEIYSGMSPNGLTSRW